MRDRPEARDRIVVSITLNSAHKDKISRKSVMSQIADSEQGRRMPCDDSEWHQRETDGAVRSAHSRSATGLRRSIRFPPHEDAPNGWTLGTRGSMSGGLRAFGANPPDTRSKTCDREMAS